MRYEKSSKYDNKIENVNYFPRALDIGDYSEIQNIEIYEQFSSFLFQQVYIYLIDFVSKNNGRQQNGQKYSFFEKFFSVMLNRVLTVDSFVENLKHF